MNIRYLYILSSALLLLAGCDSQPKVETTPWGTVVGSDSIPDDDEAFSLSDIQTNGELIVLTMTGPDSYYEYHGKGMGVQYLLAEKFAQKLGVSLRVDVCKDTAEMVRRLKDGEADIVAYMLPKAKAAELAMAGVRDSSGQKGWLVADKDGELAKALNGWFKQGMIAQTLKDENFLLSTGSVKRRVFSPMLNRAGGVISRYDRHFQQYAPLARWDWRLIAAQCYQESTFDPQARSWAGACGLMQIMPTTADVVGLSRNDLFDPEKNIAAACKYIAMLNGKFSDVRERQERINFVLASYNGGFYHVRDAMALAEKYGKNKYRWADVREFILGLQTPHYYNDPVVKSGYMRGSETADYVDRINARYADYRGVARGASGFTSFGGGSQTPHRAVKKKRKYEVK